VKLPEPPLLVITDRRQARRPVPDIVRAALAGGCRWISLRERDLGEDEQVALLETLLQVVRPFDARLTLHGDARVAQRCGLDGVHLSANGDPTAARRLLGPDKLVGLSIHGVAEAAALDPALVDYAIAGPFHETQSKPGYGPALGHAGLAEIVSAARVPVVAIGGIDATNIRDAMGAGAAGIAVMGSIMRAADPAEEVSTLINARAKPAQRPRYVATP
jgi:thiamine-phosphate pyrophosphorylase